MHDAPQQLSVQAARVLEHMKTLEDCYGTAMEQSDPEAARALRQAVDALERVLEQAGERRKAVAG